MMGVYAAPGADLSLIVSDPFELAGIHLKATVVETRQVERREALLVLLATPLLWGGVEYEHLVVFPRHAGITLEDVLAGRDSGAITATGLRHGVLSPNADWGESNWRDGDLGFLGSLQREVGENP